MTKTSTASKLNELLRGEISAIETYCQAIENIKESNIAAILEEAHNCHAKRANTLKEKLRELGAEPVLSLGVMGVVNKFVESGVQIFGDRATIALLEEGEDQSLAQYKALADDPDLAVRKLARELLPKQEDTHNIMRDLKVSTASG